MLMRRLEDERDKCRDEARAARGRVLELEGGMNARQAVDGEVAALRREVAALRASSNGHTVDPDEIKRLKKEHKAALKAALRDGGSSSEREKEELMAAMEREVEQIVGEDQLKQLKFKIRFEHLKKTKTVDEVWAELPEENKKVLLDMMIAKQAPKGKPLACVN